MSGAYVGRRELLGWLNALCGTRLTRVEQLSSGAEACEVLHALFPGCVALHRVKKGALQRHEVLHNYKLLQQALTALGVEKQVPVDRLMNGGFQDNLEFLRWLKAFYDHHTKDAAAQPADRRGSDQDSKRLVGGVAAAGRTPMRKKAASTATPYRRRASRACFGDDTDDVEMLEKQMENMKIKSKGLAVEKEELEEKKQALETQVLELKEAHELVKSERDFYLKKLEEIAALVHESELSKTTSVQSSLLALSILDVLFATEEDEQEQEMEPF